MGYAATLLPSCYWRQVLSQGAILVGPLSAHRPPADELVGLIGVQTTGLVTKTSFASIYPALLHLVTVRVISTQHAFSPCCCFIQPCNTHTLCFDRNNLSFCFFICTSAFCMLCRDQCFTTHHLCSCEKVRLVWLGLGDPNKSRKKEADIQSSQSGQCSAHSSVLGHRLPPAWSTQRGRNNATYPLGVTSHWQCWSFTQQAAPCDGAG